jgi:PmbA protein
MPTNSKDIVTRALAEAKRAGASDAEVMLERNRVLSVQVRDGAAESVKQADRRGLGLRVFVDRKPALVYTSDFRPEALASLATKAVALAQYGVADPSNELASPAGAGADAAALQLFDPAIAAMTPDDAVKRAVEAERAGLAADKRVTQSQGASCSATRGETWIVNTKGVDATYTSTAVSLNATLLAPDEGGKKQIGGYGDSERQLSKLRSPEAIGRKAAQRAAMLVGAKKIPTTKMPVLMHPDVAAGWIQNLFGAFSGDQVFKKASFLSDKLDQTIGSSLITIVDDGLMVAGVGTAPFDAEGLPTQRLALLDKGTVRHFVYDSRWAIKAGAKSTGNASRGYTSSPFIGSHNLYIENGTTPFDELMKSLDRAFYIVDTGAFGYQANTGGWSYQAKGHWIEKGEIVHPVSEVTLASDSLTMLKGISKVANDLEFDGTINSPHLLIDEMTLSGA